MNYKRMNKLQIMNYNVDSVKDPPLINN